MGLFSLLYGKVGMPFLANLQMEPKENKSFVRNENLSLRERKRIRNLLSKLKNLTSDKFWGHNVKPRLKKVF